MTYQEARNNRLKAIEQGLKTYVGRPCKTCGFGERSVKNHSECLHCKKTRWKNYVATERGHTLRKEAFKRFNNSEKGKKYKKNHQLLKNYNLTLEQYNEMKNLQNNECFCCSEKVDVLVVDHDHETGENRTLLCNRCNYIIGFLKENVEYAYKVIDYIKYCNELRNAYYRKVA